MLKAPVAGAVKTRLARGVGAARAAAIYRELAVRQVRALPPDWPAAVHFAPARAGRGMRRWLEADRAAPSRPLRFVPQPRGSLGPRLVAAFAAEFRRGARGVVVIGGDCPYLSRAVLRRTARALRTADLVIGPACDGGYYLIALRRLHRGLFRKIDWSTPRVFAQTMERARSAGLQARLLPALEDVDDLATWRRAVAAGVLAAPGRKGR